jgi:hypothetical protein
MLGRINLSWRGQKLANEHVAKDVFNGAAEKKELKESLSVKHFELGANNEGCCRHNHVALQLEDCVDCLKVVHPEFDFVSLFDHSSERSKQQRGGLDARNMNSGFGGAQPVMQNNSIVVQIDGCLGPCDAALSVGRARPFWTNAVEQNE